MTDERECARNYWKSFGFTYKNINNKDIQKLRDLIKWELQTYLPTTDHSRSMDMRLNNERKKDFKFDKDENLLWGGIWVAGSYFDYREAIFFNDNGFIGFCGWADGENQMPFIFAFKKWCDYLQSAGVGK